MSHNPTHKPQVALLTGGGDKPYAFGLATALISRRICFDLIASDELDSPQLRGAADVNFLNLRGNQDAGAPLAAKVFRVLMYYARLVGYAFVSRALIFHILWNNKFETFDRTLLMFYYKLLGKKIVLTVHNVNAGRRDTNDTALNRATLKIQYRLADHIFVHTPRMKQELVEDFGVGEPAVTVIPFGINNSVPDTGLTPPEARRRVGIAPDEKAILFFGNIAPYKGLEYLVAAFQQLAAAPNDYRLMIVGRPRSGAEKYWEAIRQTISDADQQRIVQRIEFVPDEDTELYFKAADVLILPYTEIFQSGVLFLGYSFGLPAIVADVGSLGDDVVAGETGFVCRARDSADLARVIGKYFASELYRSLPVRRRQIRDYAAERHSWDTVAEMTQAVYTALLPERVLTTEAARLR